MINPETGQRTFPTQAPPLKLLAAALEDVLQTWLRSPGAAGEPVLKAKTLTVLQRVREAAKT